MTSYLSAFRQPQGQCLEPTIYNNSDQTNGPAATIPGSPVVSKEMSFEVRKIDPRSGLVILRHLLSRLFIYGTWKCLSPEEYLLISEAHEVVRNCRDVSFSSKHGWEWLALKLLYRGWSHHSSQDTIPEFLRKQGELLRGQGHLQSAHEFYGMDRVWNPWRFLRKINRRLRKPPPPRAFVGVGYRDHGSSRNAAFDGSPHWTEVVSALAEEAVITFPIRTPLGPTVLSYEAWRA